MKIDTNIQKHSHKSDDCNAANTSIHFNIQKYHLSLIEWQKKQGRNNLPWQKSFNPYSVWVSEIMLQQTQVKTVIEYFNKFILSFPDIYSLAMASEDEVMNHWAGLGYYARARNLHKSAKIISLKFNGKFPTSYEQIISLPGIGKSTANAILSICYGQATPILDGNVKRIFSRLFAIDQPTSTKQVENMLWDISKKLMPKDNTQKYTQGLMDLGSLICTRTKPACKNCPIQNNCKAFIKNQVNLYPVPKIKKTKPTKSTIFYLYKNHHSVFLSKNESKGIWGGLYTLPEAELTGVKSHRSRLFLENQKHIFTHFRLNFDVMLITVQSIENINLTPNDKWVQLDDMASYPLPTPIKRILSELMQSNL